MAKENILKEAKRRKDEFPGLTGSEIVKAISIERKNATVSDINALTCPACGHEWFTKEVALDYSESPLVTLWSCGGCGHTNHF